MTPAEKCPECGAEMGEVEASSHVVGGWVCVACGYQDTPPFVCTCWAGVSAPGAEHFFECPLYNSRETDWGEEDEDMDDDPDDWQDICRDGGGRQVTCEDCDDYGCPDNPETWAGREP